MVCIVVLMFKIWNDRWVNSELELWGFVVDSLNINNGID